VRGFENSARESLVGSEAFGIGDIFSYTEDDVDLTVQKSPAIASWIAGDRGSCRPWVRSIEMSRK
jgi:hypothetical protein